jgi:hypothetical protein
LIGMKIKVSSCCGVCLSYALSVKLCIFLKIKDLWNYRFIDLHIIADVLNVLLCNNAAYMDVGDMNTLCQKCGAMVWYGERAQKQSASISPDISMCCMKGNVTLPYMIQPPPLLRDLFRGVHPRSSHFISNIRSYNNMFSFTSMGGKVNNGAGPPQFVISGQNYHRIGSLVPTEGQRPKFCQLYIYDTENELANRLSHFRFYSSCLCSLHLRTFLIYKYLSYVFVYVFFLNHLH